MPLVSVDRVGKFYGAEEILQDVSFTLEKGDHVALVGSNGAGKSTLLRILAGLEEPDSGTVWHARGTSIGYLPQEPELTADATLYESMLEPFAEVIAAGERLRALERDMSPDAMEEYGRLQATVEHAGYDFRRRIDLVLAGLDLPEELWQAPTSALSGGQRTRANLAKTLLHDADVLLLDEPTNHLDISALEWLEVYLQRLERAFIIVAHDRYLLDRVTHRTLELADRHVTPYDAPYGRYLVLRAERAERLRQEYAAQQQHIAKTEEFIRRYGAGQRYKEARGRQKRLDRLQRVEAPREESTVGLRLLRAQRSGDIVLESLDLVAGFPNKALVRLPERLTVRRGERIALIGPNGSGKTTLLRTFLHDLPAVEGRSRWGARTTVGYYSQTLGRLDESRTVLEEVQSVKSMSEEEARTYLGRFLFSDDDVFKTVSVLSGGERSRVALAKLILEAPNVLVLDEPTNHLDIASRDALQAVLAGFTGTLLFVSHDRYLIDALADQLWVIEGGRLVRYAGNYSAFVAGEAKRLDHDPGAGKVRPQEAAAPEDWVRGLEAQAAEIAAVIAASGPSTTVARLDDLTTRYSGILQSLQEAHVEWTRSIRKTLRASSGLRDRSDVGRPR